ncbi:21292_t:CDS:1, partial [Gigaspora rosea]
KQILPYKTSSAAFFKKNNLWLGRENSDSGLTLSQVNDFIRQLTEKKSL